MNKRVVITGLGVVSPNGVGLDLFTNALREGLSGIKHIKEMQDLLFSCQIGGIPQISEEYKRNYFTELQLKGFKVSRNNLSLILKNPLYMGKIVVPAQDDEIEKWVEGIHQGIIRESQFYKVQKLLNQRKLSTKRPGSNTLREELPLRGKLQCSKCTGKMTGSPSRSGNGNQYFYYHCNHCKKERYAAKKVNSVFESILEDFVFTKQSQVLYKEILKAALGADQGNIARKKLKIEKELSQLSNRIDKLQDLLVDGAIDPQSYGKT